MPITSNVLEKTASANTLTNTPATLDTKSTIKIAKRTKTKNKSRLSLSVETDELKNVSDYDNVSDHLDRCFSDSHLNSNSANYTINHHLDLDIVTLGQYLQPSPKHLPVVEFIEPKVFEELHVAGKKMGFRHVESGPLVRSSYHAEKHIH